MKSIALLACFACLCFTAFGADTDSLTQLGIKGFDDAKQGFRNSPVDFLEFGSTGNLGGNVNDAVTISVSGYSSIGFKATAPTGGIVCFEASFDGITFERVSMRSITDDVIESETNNGSNFVGSVSGARLFRWRTSSAGSAPGTIIGQVLGPVSTLEGQEFGPPPHRFGYAPIHADASYTTAQTNTVVYQVPVGYVGVATDIVIVISGTTDCQVKLFDETDSAGNYLFKGSIEVATKKNFIFSHAFRTPFVFSGAGHALKITTSADCDLDFMGHGYIF